MSEDVLIRTTAGTMHRGSLAESGSLRTDERCNLDDAAGHELATSDDLANSEDLCDYCFPPIPADDAA